VQALEQQVFVGILEAADRLTQELAELLAAKGLSPSLYNVLRILRGAGDEGLRCSDIAERMITRGPDVTRLVDRLERRRLVRRDRQGDDRRVVRVRIRPTGRDLLAGLDRPVLELHRRQLGHLGERRLRGFLSVLRGLREGR
jgi:DNA-binding MarR family transcriptional regulator